MVCDPHDILFDYGAFVEVRGDKMGGSTDQFYSAVMSLVVWFGALKSGQKTVMNVDAAASQKHCQAGAQASRW